MRVIKSSTKQESGAKAAAHGADLIKHTIAEKGTIRGDFGQDKMRNLVHASDSVENGQAELKRFFAEGELHG